MRALSHADGGTRKALLPLWYLAAGLAGSAWLLGTGAALAEEANPCADAATTIEIRECLDKAYTRRRGAECRLERGHGPGRRRGLSPREGTKAWKEELLTSQRAWIQFKEHDCHAVGFEWYCGSGAGGAILSCLLEHTEARTKDLRARYLDR
jgi:uncharacterized protein YecT (DUF1311 family)